MSIYCTYLTTYRGNKLPNFYIGSTKVERILSGYRGSVSSKLYRNIWIEELSKNPHLFSTKIISYHNTNEEAKEKELFFHRSLDVVKSSLYVNTSEARKNGFFGKDVSGSNNPMFGRRGINSPNFGKKRTEETRKKMSKSNSRPMSEEQKKKLSIINTGKTYSEEYKRKMSMILKGKKHKTMQCPHCKKIAGAGGIKRYHMGNCKNRVIDIL
jgi:hypothetical protein